MKVVYEPGMVDSIIDAIEKAKRSGKKIKRIVLSQEEFKYLKIEIGENVILSNEKSFKPDGMSKNAKITFCGVEIHVAEKEGVQ